MNLFKQQSVLVLMTFIFISCGGSKNIANKTSTQDQRIITEIYEEGELFIVDEFLIRENALAQRVSHQEFRSQQARAKYLESEHGNSAIGKSIIVDKGYDLIRSKKVWEVRNEWSLEWESKYSEWIKNEFTQTFFLDHNISTDCADVAFVLRWIFARINYLPAANSMAGSGKIISQDSFIRKWKKLKRSELWYEDEVFLAALEVLKDSTYSRTLKADTYPVQLSKEAFREGVIQLNPTHVRVISNIIYDGSGVPILKQYSTRPTAVRPMAQEVMLNFKAIPESDGGFVKFRWPKKSRKSWKLVESKKMSWFSKDQYQEKFLDGSINFTKYLMEKLDIKMNARATVSSMLGAIKEFVYQRDLIVSDGYNFCQQNSCDLGSVAYDDWSTPSRDKRVVEFFEKIDLVVQENLSKDPEIANFYQNLKTDTFVDLQYAQVGMSMKQVEEMFRSLYLSYDPRDEISLRWAQDVRGQHLALKRKVQRLLDLRMNKIEKAQKCRETQKCVEGTDLYTSLNTIETDKELKKYVKNIKNLCDTSEEYCFKTWNADIMNITNYQSKPNLSLEKRYGVSEEINLAQDD